MKGLEGLPKALIAKIMAKEKAKQIRDMVENDSDRKEMEMLEDLITLGPKVINIYNSEKQRQRKAAVEINDFVKLTSDSYGRISVKDMNSLLRFLIKMNPEYFEIIQLRKCEYFKMKAGAPDMNKLVAKVKGMIAERSKV